jgi:hypothetical protein
MTRSQRNLLKLLLNYYYENPATNINADSYEIPMTKKDISVLQAKGLVIVEWDMKLEAWTTLTNKGITYFEDRNQNYLNIVTKSIFLPVITAILTTFFLKSIGL